LGVTVRFTVAGVTSLRCDLAMCFTLAALLSVRTTAPFTNSRPNDAASRNSFCDLTLPPYWTGRGAFSRADVCWKYL
jgi:hypothetical protein